MSRDVAMETNSREQPPVTVDVTDGAAPVEWVVPLSFAGVWLRHFWLTFSHAVCYLTH